MSIGEVTKKRLIEFRMFDLSDEINLSTETDFFRRKVIFETAEGSAKKDELIRQKASRKKLSTIKGLPQNKLSDSKKISLSSFSQGSSYGAL